MDSRKTLSWIALALLLVAAQALPAQDDKADYQAKLKAVNRMNGDDWYQLGMWCKSRMMWPQASSAFRKAISLGPNCTAKASYELAAIAYGNNRLDTAIAWLERARAADPNFAKANELYDKVKGKKGTLKEKALTNLANAYKAKKFNKVIEAIEKLVGKPGKDKMEEKKDVLDKALGEDVYKVLVECRLKGVCPRCNGGGFIRCYSCLGKGYRIGSIAKQDSKDVLGRRTKHKKYLRQCGSCKGTGAKLCPVCKGAGLNIRNPYDGEKAMLVKDLLQMAQNLLKKRSKRRGANTVEEYRRAVKTAALYKMALELDPDAAAEADKNVERNAKRAQSKVKSAEKKLAKELKARYKEMAKKMNATYIEPKEDK